MLSTNKKSMDSNLKDLYDSFETAAYNAYYEANKPEMPDIDSDEDKLGSLSKQANDAVNEIDSKVKDKATIFADEFVKQLKSDKLLETISDEIDGHVKAIKDGLTITMQPQGIATIIAPPSGPCTGSMVISTATATINIT
jgi:hypothetical protein